MNKIRLHKLMKFRRSICSNKLALLILLVMSGLRANCASLSVPPLPPDVVSPNTNRYHLTFTWDAVSNAEAYAVIIKSNDVEVARAWTATNYATVSNLSAALDFYRFSCVASNSAGQSPESNPATLRWMKVLESDSLSGPWTVLASNSFAPTAPQHFITLSNWTATALLRRDE